MLKVKQLLLLLFTFIVSNTAFSQLGIAHEIGVIAGPVAFKSDYGLRTDWDTNAGNMGLE